MLFSRRGQLFLCKMVAGSNARLCKYVNRFTASTCMQPVFGLYPFLWAITPTRHLTRGHLRVSSSSPTCLDLRRPTWSILQASGTVSHASEPAAAPTPSQVYTPATPLQQAALRLQQLPANVSTPNAVRGVQATGMAQQASSPAAAPPASRSSSPTTTRQRATPARRLLMAATMTQQMSQMLSQMAAAMGRGA